MYIISQPKEKNTESSRSGITMSPLYSEMTVKQEIWQKFSREAIFLFIMICSIGCQTGKHAEIQDYIIQLKDLESIIQSGNWLKFYSDDRAEPYSGTLNPGKIISMNREYHILKFELYNKIPPIKLQDSDTLTLILDGRALHLTAYNVSEQEDRLTAYYNIDKWDIVDLGYASNIVVIINSEEGRLRTSFSSENIYNYRYFSAKYILKTGDIPPRYEPEYKQPIAFISGGAGTGIDFWLGYYTNFLQKITALGDYVALGIGLSTFKYDIYNMYYGHGYLWDGNFTENNYNLNVMYGLSYPSPFGNWSFEVGVTYQYYFHDKNWNADNTGSKLYPTVYLITDNKPRNESLIGAFVQVGGLWLQWNRKKLWALGISIPIPWWQ
jgi:hypothetical protein